ncbi:unnamed protein product [Enterobius vermicularis]|uniref:P-type domain-containing protein n=1 Tax=Enterobius vermicularis TaxID=51028 RepID=A0A0N4VIP5_ENTVE|nr:unnamed protein product [Enterobius vermicularis]
MAKLLSVVIVWLVGSTVYGEKPRLDCHPDPSASEEKCSARGCIWDNSSEVIGAPFCLLPPNTGYNYSNFADGVYVISNSGGALNWSRLGNPIESLKVGNKTNKSALNIRIEGDKSRYEPPVNLPKEEVDSKDHLNFEVTSELHSLFTFKISRNSTGTVIWDTSIGGLLYYDQYIQIATLLPSENVFGFGEHLRLNLRHNLSRYTTWPMFARDDGPFFGESDFVTKNFYGVHPFYLCIEKDGNAHGVLFLNSNAQEVTLGPEPSLVYRTIGGILDITFFPGPTPDQVIQQYLTYIGKPVMPAYWGLGFQLSRWGYETLDDMKEAIERTQNASIPLDVMYSDIDYMDRYKDFTEKVSFIKWPSSEVSQTELANNYSMLSDKTVMLGNVWPDWNTVMPDFLDVTNNTVNWWINEFVTFHNHVSNSLRETLPNKTSEEFAKLHCPVGGKYNLDDPPYRTQAAYLRGSEYLSAKTLCMIGVTGSSNFYNTKSLYGWAQMKATAEALKVINNGKRGILVSRSTFVSAGRYGTHWLGDNFSTWKDIRASIIGIIEFNMFGMPFVGADICGFNWNTTQELCHRWHQLGAFYPFCRNHASREGVPQDPGLWPDVATAAREALMLRYKLLPYLYSLLYNAHLYGGMVARPLYFSHPKDETAMKTDDQFMWGDSIMFTPVLYENTTDREAYFPPGYWYSIRSNDYGKIASDSESGQKKSVHAPLDWNTPAFLLGGKIVPTQVPATTTKKSRKNPFGLIIALKPSDTATGELYWDDGESNDGFYYHFDFKFQITPTNATLTILQKKVGNGNLSMPALDFIDIMGYDYIINQSSLTLGSGEHIEANVTSDREKNLLLISRSGFLSMQLESSSLTWQHQISPSTMPSTITTASPTITTASPTITTAPPTITTAPTKGVLEIRVSCLSVLLTLLGLVLNNY